MPFLLDTDTVSLAFNKNERVRARIRQAISPGVWLSGIAAEEIMRGALSVISGNRDKIGMVAAHNFFARSLSSICEYRIHPYNQEAALIYASFPPQVKRLGTQDC
ncbi:MAG: type II toxin-antitoxin system VapC family toxin [Janthinobacterium lividum]